MAVHGVRRTEMSLLRLVDGFFGGVAHVEEWAEEHLVWTRAILLAVVVLVYMLSTGDPVLTSVWLAGVGGLRLALGLRLQMTSRLLPREG